jgi:hypothetical protein
MLQLQRLLLQYRWWVRVSSNPTPNRQGV